MRLASPHVALAMLVSSHNLAEPYVPTERRKYQRFALHCKCWLEGDEVTIFGTTADLGLGGLFLRSAVPIDRGFTVEIQLHSRDAERRLIACGVVTRTVRATPGRRHGLGVEFLEVRGGRGALTSFLEGQR